MNATEVSPAFIEQWDIHKIMEPLARDITPTSASITESAGESKASRAKPKFAKSKNRATVSTCLSARKCSDSLYSSSGITYYHGTATLSALYMFSKGSNWSWSARLGFRDIKADDRCLTQDLSLCIVSQRRLYDLLTCRILH